MLHMSEREAGRALMCTINLTNDIAGDTDYTLKCNSPNVPTVTTSCVSFLISEIAMWRQVSIEFQGSDEHNVLRKQPRL